MEIKYVHCNFLGTDGEFQSLENSRASMFCSTKKSYVLFENSGALSFCSYENSRASNFRVLEESRVLRSVSKMRCLWSTALSAWEEGWVCTSYWRPPLTRVRVQVRALDVAHFVLRVSAPRVQVRALDVAHFVLRIVTSRRPEHLCTVRAQG
ncbi:hypothetical protein AMTRI_Chr03g149610 [Amborella trichopoda]